MNKLYQILTFAAIAILISTNTQSQVPFEFGKTSKEDFDLEAYREKYPEADAVIIGDVGFTEFILNKKKLTFEYKHIRTTRYLVLTENGLDYGNISIPYVETSSRKDVILYFRAYVHNKDKNTGKVKRNKIKKRGGYVIDETKYVKSLNYALPEIAPGTIFEVKYTKISERIENLPTWNFQQSIPVEYSDFTLDLPSAFSYRMRLRGSESLHKKDITPSNFRASYNQRYLHMSATKYNWVAINIPPMEEEPFVDNIKNYFQAMTFELVSVDFDDPSTAKHYTKSWEDVLAYLNKSSGYGEFLKASEDALNKHININASDDFNTNINNAVNAIKEKIRWNNKTNIFSWDEPEEVFNNNSGNSAAINLLLYAQLNKMGIEAYPVLLSTVDNIKLFSESPVLSELNYIIVAAFDSEGNYVLLDATEPELPPGYIPVRAINGKGIILHEDKTKWIHLSNPDSKQITSNYNLKINNKGEFFGEFEEKYFFYSKYMVKKQYHIVGEEKFKNNFLDMPGVKVAEVEIIDSEDHNEAFIVKGKILLEGFSQVIGDEIFFEPLLLESENENIFKSKERKYPVEFFVPSLYTTNITIDIPSNINIISIPESQKMYWGGNLDYNFVTENDEKQITINAVEKISKTSIHQNNYLGLVNYFSKIVDINKQKVVLEIND